MNADDTPVEEPPSGLRTTVILTVIVAGLFLLVQFADVMTSREAELKTKRVFPFLATADVERLELTAPEGAKVVLVREAARAASEEPEKKKDDEPKKDEHGHEDGAEEPGEKDEPKEAEPPRRWLVEEPVKDLADESEVFRVLNGLEWLEYSSKLEGAAAKELTFGDVIASGRIERKAGPAISFELGAESLGTRPLRVAGETDVLYLLKGGKLHEDLAQDPWKFRKKQLFDRQRDLVNEVTLRVAPEQAGPGAADREVVLLEVESYWRVGGKDGEFADEGLVTELTTDAYGLRAIDAVVESPSDADLQRLGLKPPRATLALAIPGKKGAPRTVQELALGAPVEGKPDQRHARFTDRPVVFTVDASALKNELERPLEGWRSNALVVVRGDAQSLTGFAVEFDDGSTWGITQEDRAWTFDAKVRDAPPVMAASAAVEALLGEVLALDAIERVPGPHDKKALGLDPPLIKLGIVQVPLRRELHIGAPKPGAPGVHYVARVGEDRVFTARIDALPSRLRDGPLDLLEKTLFKASEWEAKKLVVSDPLGKVLFEAIGSGDVREWKVIVPASPDAESDRVRELLARFKEVKVERWSALDTPEARRQVGLDQPTRVVVTVEAFKDGKPTDVEKVLLLGRREGERVHAVAQGGTAIGKIDATFLDVIARGFAKGTLVLESDRWDVKELVVKDGEQVVLELEKPAENWLRTDGGAQQLVETTDVEDLLQRFERIEVSRVEPRADARLAEVGLAPPARTITITSRPGGGSGAPVTKTLLIGQRAGEREVWATAEGASSIGVLFDEPLRELDRWRDEHAPPASFPPVDDASRPEDGQQGSVPAPRGEVSCGVCSAKLPGGGPFTFRDPNPPHQVHETCSMGHLEELKQAVAEGRDPKAGRQ